jgi:hypothetical protein
MSGEEVSMNIARDFFFSLIAAAFVTGCAPELAEEDDDEEAVSEAVQALMAQNGFEMNGTMMNGTFLNGIKANGIKANGIKANGIKANGIKANGTSLEGTLETGLTISGAGFAGADMDAVLGDSTATTVHISSIASNEVPGLLTYEIEQGGSNICGSTGAKALVVHGRWDYLTGNFIDDDTQLTVACRGAAIANALGLHGLHGHRTIHPDPLPISLDSHQLELRRRRRGRLGLLHPEWLWRQSGDSASAPELLGAALSRPAPGLAAATRHVRGRTGEAALSAPLGRALRPVHPPFPSLSPRRQTSAERGPNVTATTKSCPPRQPRATRRTFTRKEAA